MSFARKVSSQVLFLHQGLVEEEGAPEDVLGNPEERASETVPQRQLEISVHRLKRSQADWLPSL